jgi:hypothetical protein
VTRPVVELAAAVVVMLFGAWLIGWWVVGLVLIVLGVLGAADAVLRDDDGRVSKQQLSDEVLERYRRAR